MKGSEKQVTWANDIIAKHDEMIVCAIKKAEKNLSRNMEDDARTSLSKKLGEYKKIQTLNWSETDASKIIDMSRWVNASKFSLVTFYNIMLVVFGMNNDVINKFFAAK